MKVLLSIACISITLLSQAQDRVLPAESAVTSTGDVMIKGKRVPYKVTAGTQPVFNAEGKPSASLFYTYYERTDVTDKSKRPFVMSFNGGPKSISARDVSVRLL
jgi:carboxypeptidase C (cathepsin A)